MALSFPRASHRPVILRSEATKDLLLSGSRGGSRSLAALGMTKGGEGLGMTKGGEGLRMTEQAG